VPDLARALAGGIATVPLEPPQRACVTRVLGETAA
jgi:hypothetical protein